MTFKTSIEEMQYGLKQEVPKNSPAAWIGRAIQECEKLDIVPNRTDRFAIDKRHDRALNAALDHGLFASVIRNRYEEEYNKGNFDSSQRNVVTLYEDNVLVIKGDTRASGGYVYLCAYLKPSEDVSEAIKPDHPDYNKDKPIKWSSSKDIPEVGDRVVVKMNRIGKSVVLKRDVSAGFVLLYVSPDNPPPDYRKQKQIEGQAASYKYCGIFGVDLES